MVSTLRQVHRHLPKKWSGHKDVATFDGRARVQELLLPLAEMDGSSESFSRLA